MVKITDIEENSIAHTLGIRPGDVLISINNHEINDLIDFEFFISEEMVNVKIRRGKQITEYEIEKNYDDKLGIHLEEFKVRSCNNNCIFCFVNQNPPGLRKTLYFKDEDYRLSFLYGNYITMTNIDDLDLKRIVDMRLSPLYLSIHATDPTVRKKIFQRGRDDNLFDKLDYLTKGGIELHVQIVLMPGINDGEILEKTISDLYHYKESIKSVAIVPVGLTKHRKNKPKITPIDSEYARKLIKASKKWTKNYFNVEGNRFIYLSDEFFLLAGRPIPASSYYGFYYQIDNGVGLTRVMLDNFKKDSRRFPNKLKKDKRILFITGMLAKPILEAYILPVLNSVEGMKVDVIGVVNNLFGHTVTVSGLLAGKDIIEQTKFIAPYYDMIVLPPRCINEDSILIDDVSTKEIEEELGTKVTVFDNDFLRLMEHVEE